MSQEENLVELPDDLFVVGDGNNMVFGPLPLADCVGYMGEPGLSIYKCVDKSTVQYSRWYHGHGWVRVPQKRAVIIDSMNIISRMFYAIPMLTSTSGFPVNAVKGWINSIWALSDFLGSPDVIYACFEGGSGGRHEILPEYKQNRSTKPSDIVKQEAFIRDPLCEQMGIKPLQIDGYEADDVIGSLAAILRKDHHVYIASKDKDLSQCLTMPNVSIIRPETKGGWMHVFPHKAKEVYGFEPRDVALFLALSGDSSDNIPGLRGVGEKTACAWITKHSGDLDAMLADESLTPPKLAASLRENEAQVRTYLDAATLRVVPLADCAIAPIEPDVDGLAETIDFLNLKSIKPLFDKRFKRGKVTACAAAA